MFGKSGYDIYSRFMMTYIEAKLDSYDKKDYKLYNKYFGGQGGLDDYTDKYGKLTLWDKIHGISKSEKKKQKEEAREKLEKIAEKLSRDFKSIINK